MHPRNLYLLMSLLLIAGLFVIGSKRPRPAPIIISHVVDMRTQEVRLYWKDDTGQIFGNIEKLKNWLDAKGEKLVFAMNAGMFKADYSPHGLFMQDHKTLEKLDTATGHGNFYLKPNGVFYTTTRDRWSNPSCLQRRIRQSAYPEWRRDIAGR